MEQTRSAMVTAAAALAAHPRCSADELRDSPGVTKRRLLRWGALVAVAAVAILGALTAAGIWCPWSFLRFGGGSSESTNHRHLEAVKCLEVAEPVTGGNGRLAWRTTHRITSPARIAAIRDYLSAHRSGWQENIFTSDTSHRMFRACDGAESRPRFILGAETLGVYPSKNWSRPLCRRDRAKLHELIRPEA
jgi:hypothetical protein